MRLLGLRSTSAWLIDKTGNLWYTISMPFDSVDRYRDEDYTEKRKRSRRRYKVGGRRSTDNPEPGTGARLAVRKFTKALNKLASH